MINKEIILNADGSIKKDFQDRNIPQYSNNQVSVNVLIPSTCFTGLQNYAVILGVSRTISGVETTLNSLIMTASKTITLEGVLYVKYSAILSYSYTDKIGTLKVSPYIQTTATTTISDESVEVISIQQSFTNSNLNVIKSVLPQYDASLEEGTIATTLAEQIAEKKIYTFVDTDSASIGQHYYELATGYDPSADQFKGCLVMSVYGDETRQYIPYLNDGDVELLEITKDGKFYHISGVDYSNSTYTYTRLQLSYSKSEIDGIESGLQNQITNLSNNKVDKTTKVNGKALSSDITLDKSDVGLGNVANYGVESTPTASGESLYITSKGVYDYCQLIYSALNGYATTGDLSAINTRLESVEAIIGSDDGDADSVINTLKEVIVVLNGLGEGANLLDLINAKANQTDLTALDNEINATNGIKDKVDFLYSTNSNAYMEIKATSGTIDIAVSDWVSNADASYPYKWTLTNGYLVGATNVIVVFSIDSDTSMISPTTEIDDTNGSITIYASALPEATIKIEKVAVFNSVEAYINYSNTIVQQVETNTSAISEINNTKLPLYELKQESLGTNKGTKSQGISGGFWRQIAKRTSNSQTRIEQSYEEICLGYGISDTIDAKILVKKEAGYDGLIKLQNGFHTLQLDHSGLTLDGNAVGGGGISGDLKDEVYDSAGGTYYQPLATIDWTSVRALTYDEDDCVYIYGDLMNNIIPAIYFNFMTDNGITYYSARMFGYDENNQGALYCIFDTAGFDMYGNILDANKWYKIPLGTGTYVAEAVSNTDIPNWNLDTNEVLSQSGFALLFAEATTSQTLAEKFSEVEASIPTIEANPTLAGTEGDLEGIEIDGTKYKVGGGKQLYAHHVMLYQDSVNLGRVTFTIINERANAYTMFTEIGDYLFNLGLTVTNSQQYMYHTGYEASGFLYYQGTLWLVNSILCETVNDEHRLRCISFKTSDGTFFPTNADGLFFLTDTVETL